MSKDELISFLIEVKRDGIVSIDKSTEQEYRDKIYYALDKGYLERTISGNYRINAHGIDFINHSDLSTYALSFSINPPNKTQPKQRRIVPIVKYVLSNIWKFIVLVTATFLGGWLAVDHNFKEALQLIQNFFK